MTNFVTVEKNPVYISSMSHTKHSVKKKDSFLSLFFFWLLESLFMPYGNIVVCHSIITRGLLLDMWQQWAQSKHNRNEGSVTRPRAVGRFENPGGGGGLCILIYPALIRFILLHSQLVPLYKFCHCGSKIVFCCYNCLDLSWENFFQVWVTFFPVLESRNIVLRKGCANSRP